MLRVHVIYLERDYYTHEIDVYACALLLSVGWSITHALHVYACTAVHSIMDAYQLAESKSLACYTTR